LLPGAAGGVDRDIEFDHIVERISPAILPYPQAITTLQNAYWRSSRIGEKVMLGF
jgi:hypothetical protein